MPAASASEYTATVFTPRRFAVRITRHAISPRFAIKILSNGLPPFAVAKPRNAKGDRPLLVALAKTPFNIIPSSSDIKFRRREFALTLLMGERQG
jgi:hypothetical protein